MVAKVEDKTLDARLRNARTEALVSMLADAQAHVGNKNFGHAIGNVEAETLFYTLARTQ